MLLVSCERDWYVVVLKVCVVLLFMCCCRPSEGVLGYHPSLGLAVSSGLVASLISFHVLLISHFGR